jgi:hypothetical protein
MIRILIMYLLEFLNRRSRVFLLCAKRKNSHR